MRSVDVAVLAERRVTCPCQATPLQCTPSPNHDTEHLERPKSSTFKYWQGANLNWLLFCGCALPVPAGRSDGPFRLCFGPGG